MKFFHKQINLISVVIVLTTALSLAACAEKAEDSSQTVTFASTVSEDKIAQLQREAQEGDPDAQYNLAYIYENGLGVPKDDAKALELYQKAADQGHSAAQSTLDAKNASK